MTLTLITPPAGEPVSLAEAKAHARIGSDTEDAILASLIAAARARIEGAARLALMPRRLKLTLDRWPSPALESGRFSLPVRPVSAIVSVRIIATDGSIVSDHTGNVALEDRRTLVLRSGVWPWPGAYGEKIELVFDAGFAGANSIPADLAHAVLALTAHFYEVRDGRPGDISVSELVAGLVAPFRELRI